MLVLTIMSIFTCSTVRCAWQEGSLNFIRIKEHPVTGQPKSDYSPQRLHVSFMLHSTNIFLRLRKTRDVDVNVPMFGLVEGVAVMLNDTKLKDVCLYQDVDAGASIAAYCRKSNTGSCVRALKGLFRVDGENHLIEPQQESEARARERSEPERSHVYHVIRGVKSGAIGNPGALIHFRNRRSLRYRRTAPTENIIELLIIIAYDSYKYWTEGKPLDKGLEDIRTYFALVANGIDLRYKSIKSIGISVKLTALYVAKDKPSSLWTEENKISGKDVINATGVLKSLASNMRKFSRLKFDHAMLFTRYVFNAIKENDDVQHYSVVGFAYVGKMCSNSSVSVVTEQGAMEEVQTAAHELGHSLSAQHDGDDNSCEKSSNYIMSSGIAENLNNNLNSWKFSECSIDSFKQFISNLNNLKNNCLLNKPNMNESFSSYIIKMPGQLYPLEEQCKQLTGLNSSICPKLWDDPMKIDVCLKMSCLHPEKRDQCFVGKTAARGTSCANKKWCIDGKCVYDEKAPEVQGGCLFGDSYMPVSINRKPTPCKEAITAFPHLCKTIGPQCCKSCFEHRTGSSTMKPAVNQALHVFTMVTVLYSWVP